MRALRELYSLLAERTQKIAEGLEQTRGIGAKWDEYPTSALRTYRTQFHYLYEQYAEFRNWTGLQTIEELTYGVETLRDGQKQLDTMIMEGFKQVLNQHGQNALPQNNEPVELSMKGALDDVGFKGRTRELTRIQNAFQSRKVAVLTGLGGIGKTELALKYGREYLRSANGKVHFIIFRDSLFDTMLYVYDELFPETKEHTISDESKYKIVMGHLKNHPEHDLLILDNVDVRKETFEQVLRELSPIAMRVLITTRFDADDAIEVKRLEEDVLFQIFERHKAIVSRNEKQLLITAVEGHTMTVDLIARTLRRGQVTAQRILEALEVKNLPGTQLRLIGSDYAESKEQAQIYLHLCAVFRITPMSEAEKNTLRYAVLLPTSGINADLFLSALHIREQWALGYLADNGWLVWENGRLSIHPVIRLVCREELTPNDENVRPFLDTLWASMGSEKDNLEVMGQLADLYSNAADELEDNNNQWAERENRFRYRCGSKIDSSSKKANQYPEDVLVDMFHKEKRNLESNLKNCPENRHDLFFIYYRLGRIYMDLSNARKASKCFADAIMIGEDNSEIDSSWLRILYTYASLSFSVIGNWAKQCEYGVKALDMLENSSPINHKHTSALCDLLSRAYLYQKKYTEALTYSMHSIKHSEKIKPPDYKSIINGYSHRTLVYLSMSDEKAALSCVKHCLHLSWAFFPEDKQQIERFSSEMKLLEFYINRKKRINSFILNTTHSGNMQKPTTVRPSMYLSTFIYIKLRKNEALGAEANPASAPNHLQLINQ